MTDRVQFRSDFRVLLVEVMGSDERVCQAARVSTVGAESLDSKESVGLINFLMKNRHGSPFEHVLATWAISAPIFVWREFMRHRIASYNEQSGRYMQLEPVFYVPGMERPLVQEGKPGHYTFVPGSVEQYRELAESIRDDCRRAYDSYQLRIEAGIAKEVARMTLPLNIYSTAYVTMNLRGLMNFLSLRTKDETSTFPSYPQYEIEVVARQMERDFKHLAPKVWYAFNDNGRVCP